MVEAARGLGTSLDSASIVSRRVHVGTAGWSLPRDQAEHFPAGPSHLARYAHVFSVTEINSTFWRRHRASTFQRWHDAVPAEFRFAVKIPRTITHEAALRSPLALLREFFADVAPLRQKLGPLLVQLPASVHFEARRAGAFFRALTSMHEGTIVCEPRHESWYGPAAEALFTARGVCRVVADPPRPASAATPGGSSEALYLRLHGAPRPYYSAYTDERLREFAALIGRRAPGSRAFCIFDNTASGAAAGDALRMIRLPLLAEPRARARRRARVYNLGMEDT